jgi:hypothetical protein
MPTEESTPQHEPVSVVDKDGKELGTIRGLSRPSRYLLVESGGIVPKVYYIPPSAISSNANGIIRLSLTEDDLRRQGLSTIPDDLYAEPGAPDVNDLPQFTNDQFALGEKIYSTELPIERHDLNPD